MKKIKVTMASRRRAQRQKKCRAAGAPKGKMKKIARRRRAQGKGKRRKWRAAGAPKGKKLEIARRRRAPEKNGKKRARRAPFPPKIPKIFAIF